MKESRVRKSGDDRSSAGKPAIEGRAIAIVRRHLIPHSAHDPQIFIFEKQELCVLISAKAACTTVTKWALTQFRQLEAAARHSNWPHDYRMEVFLRSAEYVALVDRFFPRDYKYCLVARNPYRRLLSSFCHDGLRQAILEKCGFSKRTVSFREFANAVRQNADLADVHVARQMSGTKACLNKYVDLAVIRIEDGLIPQLTELEETYHLPVRTPVVVGDILSWSHHHTDYTLRECEPGSLVDERIDLNYNGKFAPPESYFDEDLFDSVYECYEVDFRTLGYSHGIL